MNQTFTQAATGKTEKHNHCQKKNSLNICNEEQRSRSIVLLKAFLEALLVLTDAIITPSLYDKAVRHDKQHVAPLNEHAAFSVPPSWSQLLSFVSDGYFCTPFKVTVACRVKGNKRATLNSPMEIAEINVFHLLETDSLWHNEWNFFFLHKITQQSLNSRDWLWVMSWFEEMSGPGQQFRIQMLILSTIWAWVREGIKDLMAVVLMGI